MQSGKPPELNRSVSEQLTVAAWGSAHELRVLRQRSGDCLPTAREARDRWHRAVAAAARGYYAAAFADCDAIDRDPDAGAAVRSAAASTRASCWRQLGWHERAAGHDGRALALATHLSTDTDTVAATMADALTGLAADSLGAYRFRRAEALLDRATAVIAANPTGDDLGRLSLRLAWVRAECALYSGNVDHALRWADLAQERAAACPSARHRVKTALIAAAARSARGADVADLLSGVLSDTTDLGLVPLRWAAAALGEGVLGPDATCGDGTMSDIRASTAASLVRRGALMKHR